jgi:PAS domain-containing protein
MKNRKYWFSTLWKVGIPVVITLVLFVLPIVYTAIPLISDSLRKEKLEALRLLVDTPYSILENLHQKVVDGVLAENEAKKRAKATIRRLRYDDKRNGGNYFVTAQIDPTKCNDSICNRIRLWVHPIRPKFEELDNVADLKDVAGNSFITELVKKALYDARNGTNRAFTQFVGFERGERSIDEAKRKIVKTAFSRYFEPWNIVVMSSVFIPEVDVEIDKVVSELQTDYAKVFLIILVVSAVIVWQGAQSERKRQVAQDELNELNQSLEAKVVERTRELAEKENLLSLAMHNMTDGMYMLDENMRYILFNDKYKELVNLDDKLIKVGESMENVIEAHANRGDYGEGEIFDIVQQRLQDLRSDKTVSAELYQQRTDTYVDVRKAPLEAGGAVVTISDVSERKNAENELKDAHAVISSSIQYASRIQRAILPSDEFLSTITREHFICWEPRDVVGGDVYWIGPWGNGHLILLGDCTGHGVPGAFMTLISMGALERAMAEVEGGKLGELIGRMHQYIQVTLSQHSDGGSSDDGIELGACFIVPDEPTIIFTGARFELFVVNSDGVIEIKGIKKGLGYRHIPLAQEYSEVQFDVSSDQSIYLTTDGFLDQVGGERKRMFGKKRFKELLVSVQNEPMAKQKTVLHQALLDYQGEELRRDDVAFIGFKIA